METLIFLGGVIIMLWGLAHLFPTRAIITGFGELSDDNRHIITMEWLAEGLTLIFIGALNLVIAIVSDGDDSVANAVYLTSAVMLSVMAVLTLLTGFRTSIIPMKICPFIKFTVAVLFVLGIIC